MFTTHTAGQARQLAGERLTCTHTTPQTLAGTAARLLGAEVTWPTIAVNRAQRAAELITQLLPHAPERG